MTYETRLQDDEIAIFLFHGVTPCHDCVVRNYTRKHLAVDYFNAVLRRLLACGSPVDMEQVRLHYEEGAPVPPRAFAITFDDGFANNLTTAAPILVDQGIPATFYITTGFVELNYMSWTDRVEYAIEQRTCGTLRLPWGERSFARGEDRRAVLEELRRVIKQDPRIDGDALATEIQEQLGVPVTFSSDHVLDRKLTWDQVKALAKEPSFIVAGHSHSHRILEYLTDAELEQDIDNSIRLLEEKAGVRSHHYSYPEGLSFCYSTRVIDMLKRRGIRCCPNAEDGTNGAGADLFHLKRIMVT